jgi:hypothetical protein
MTIKFIVAGAVLMSAGAHAEVLGPYARTLLPAQDGAEVPRNVAPWMRVYTLPVGGWTVGFDGSAQGIGATEVEAGTYGRDFVHQLTPPLLPPNTVVSFTNGVTITFTTTEEIDETPPAGFAGDVTDIRGQRIDTTNWFADNLLVELCLPSINEEPVVVEVTTSESTVPRVFSGSVRCEDDTQFGIAVNLYGAEPREVCFDAVAIDVAGLRSPTYSFCTGVQDDNPEASCAAAPPGCMWLMLGALALRRRRR